jgi:hypothetical protein
MTLICCSVVPLWTQDMLVDALVFKMRAHYGSHPIDQINRTIPSLSASIVILYDAFTITGDLALKSGLKLDPQVFNFDSFLPSIFHFLDGSPAKYKIPRGETFLLLIYGFSR